MKQFLKSVIFALRGLRFAWEGRNFRVQSVAGVVVIITSFLLGISPAEWLVVLILIGLVLGFEMLNSAIETLVNLVSPEYNPLAGKVKDIAAGAVLLISFVAAIAGVIIFLPYVL
jgi:diacylglycerol kinase (ATP)